MRWVYWQEVTIEFGIAELRRHYERFTRRARFLHISAPVTYEGFRDACSKLVRALYEPDKDVWVRATLYVRGVVSHPAVELTFL